MTRRRVVRFLIWATCIYVLLYLALDMLVSRWSLVNEVLVPRGSSAEAMSETLGTVSVWVYLLLAVAFLVFADYSRVIWRGISSRRFAPSAAGFAGYSLLIWISWWHVLLVASYAAAFRPLVAIVFTVATLTVALETTKPERVPEGS